MGARDGELDAEGLRQWQETHGRSFGETAGAYAQHRPEWPASTAHWLVGGRPGPLRVLDLGAGTGKLTRTLVAAGHAVIAVEPDAGMLEALRREVPAADARQGSAEAIPADDGALDAVTAAQAWHWFDHERAAAECARVLRPGGVLGLGWHLRDERVAWTRELSEVVGRPADATAAPRGGALELPPPFGEAVMEIFAYTLTTTPEGLRDLADTWSYVRLAPDRSEKLAAVLALGRRVADADGRVVVPHLTRCFRAVRE